MGAGWPNALLKSQNFFNVLGKGQIEKPSISRISSRLYDAGPYIAVPSIQRYYRVR